MTYHALEPKYWIGNIEQRVNAWCFREHIYGILVEVQVEWGGRSHSRPFPRRMYHEVLDLIQANRWCETAQSLCEPPW